MDLIPLEGIGVIPFGAPPEAVRAVFGSELHWEAWMGGNLNDSLYYPGIILSFDGHNSHGPLESACLTGVEVNRTFRVNFLGIPLASLIRQNIMPVLVANGGPLNTFPNGSAQVPALNTQIWFALDGYIEILRYECAAARKGVPPAPPAVASLWHKAVCPIGRPSK